MALESQTLETAPIDFAEYFLNEEKALAAFAKTTGFSMSLQGRVEELEEDIWAAKYGIWLGMGCDDSAEGIIGILEASYLLKTRNFLLDQLGQRRLSPPYRNFLVQRSGFVMSRLEELGIKEDPFPGVFK